MKAAPEGTMTGIHGMLGLGTIRFYTIIRSGRGTREIPIDVRPELIVALARALEATKGTACDSQYVKIADHDGSGGYHVGHALWHAQNPERVMPCLNGGPIIDLNRSLTSGDSDDDAESSR